jgi:DNA-binding transcriptional regulator of glucitol operon
MIALIVIAYLICGILTAVLYRKFFGDADEMETFGAVVAWPVFVFFALLGGTARLCQYVVDKLEDLT